MVAVGSTRRARVPCSVGDRGRERVKLNSAASTTINTLLFHNRLSFSGSRNKESNRALLLEFSDGTTAAVGVASLSPNSYGSTHRFPAIATNWVKIEVTAVLKRC